MRQEIQQLNVVIGLMRRELAELRGQAGLPTERIPGGPDGLTQTGRRMAREWRRRLRLRDAEHYHRHGAPSWYGQLWRFARRRLDPRPRQPSLGILAAAANARDSGGSLEGSAAPRPRGIEQELDAAELALEQSRAIAALLRGEMAHLRGSRPTSMTHMTDTPERLIRRGAVIPTETMIPKLVGRVRVADPVDRAADLMGTHDRPTVTVATRFHDRHDLPSLERCLTSLQAQRGVDLTSIIVVQGLDEDGLRAVRATIERVWLMEPWPRVVSVPNPNGGDRRSALLNRALDIHYGETSNDFFYVLDHDDVVFSHALVTMAGPIVASSAAVSFGNVAVARYLSLHEYDFLYRMEDHFRASERDIAELAVDNFFPIHGYVYHTRAMPPGQLRFNESMDRLEDYEALLRVVTTFPVYTGSLHTLVGLYCWKGQRAIDGPIEGVSEQEAERWERNRQRLAEAFIDLTSWPGVGG